MCSYPVGWNAGVNFGVQIGSSDMVGVQQRMAMRQAQLEGAYMPCVQPSMNEIMNLQGFYNGCLGNIQQLRYGVPFSNGLFAGMPPNPVGGGMPLHYNAMSSYIDPSIMQYLMASKQQTDMTIMMCYMLEQQSQTQKMLMSMLSQQQQQVPPEYLNKMLQSQNPNQQTPSQTTQQMTQNNNLNKTNQQTIQNVDRKSAQADAMVLKNAIEGMGTETKPIGTILGSRSNAEIAVIKEEYKNMTGRSLEEDIKGEWMTGEGDAKNAYLKLLEGKRNEGAMSPAEAKFQAIKLHNAFSGWFSIDDKAVTDILCSANKEQMEAIKKEYQGLYGPIENDVNMKTMGSYKDLLTNVLNNSPSGAAKTNQASQVQTPVKQANIPSNIVSPTAPGTVSSANDTGTPVKTANEAANITKPVDRKSMQADAKALKEAIEGLGTDTKTISKILGSRTNEEIGVIKEEYKNLTGRSLNDDIKGEWGLMGETQYAYQRLLDGNRSKGTFSAAEAKERAIAIHKEIKADFSPDDKVVSDILCGANKEQIAAIRGAYNELYGESLDEALKNKTYGSYNELMNSLLNSTPSGNASSAPVTASIPNTPVIPNRPAVPNMPTIPNSPIIPNRPAVPNMPTIPNSPDSPNAVKVPTTPVVPNNPGVPNTSGTPKAPVAPNSTIKPIDRKAAEADAEKLRKAIEGLGTDTKSVSSILAGKTNEEIAAIKEEYKSHTGRTLDADIKGEWGLMGETQYAYQRLLEGKRSNGTYSVAEAKERALAIHKEIKAAFSPDDKVVTDILCGSNKEQIAAIKNAYNDLYGISLDQELGAKTYGSYKELMSTVLSSSPSRAAIASK